MWKVVQAFLQRECVTSPLQVQFSRTGCCWLLRMKAWQTGLLRRFRVLSFKHWCWEGYRLPEQMAMARRKISHKFNEYQRAIRKQRTWNPIFSGIINSKRSLDKRPESNMKTRLLGSVARIVFNARCLFHRFSPSPSGCYTPSGLFSSSLLNFKLVKFACCD